MASTFARRLRKRMTPHEVKLWLHLRALRKQGFHFRRQAPFGRYILDFVCFKYRLIIELDGSQHGDLIHSVRDRERDTVLEREGFAVLRFWNNELDENLDGVWRVILDALRAQSITSADSV
jgi:very-short-patch-repair endonuclease